LKKKTMENATIEEITVGKKKKIIKNEDKWAKQVVELGFIVEWIAPRKIDEKHSRTQFITTWTSIVVVEMGEHFHRVFQTSLRVDSRKYMGWKWLHNMGLTTNKGLGMN
jgi:hypothetical protein